ncbi:MAG: iron permease, partial [Planctomycetes bacterium]|nr:iron permease [Planctomycetota bacterium]
MPPWFWLLLYCLLIPTVSLVGGWIPLLVRLTHRRMQVAISFVSGVMLGVALMHLLPHAIYEGMGAAGSIEHVLPSILIWLLAGVLTMFFIERFFAFHQHDAPHHEAAHDAPRDFHESHHKHAHKLSWSGAAAGLAMHGAIEGLALAAAVAAESDPGRAVPLVGLSTFLVIFLHKPFDSLTVGTLMAAGGYSARSRHLVNVLLALTVPAGAILSYLGFGHAAGGSFYVAAALAFSAGTFLCIAMSDLLPEL